MLILTRRTDETINIGNEITVTVLGINGNQIRLGISASKSVEVHREEIYDRIHGERTVSGRCSRKTSRQSMGKY